MACRIGITTNEAERRQDWEREYPTLRNWRIVGSHGSKSEAQQQENQLAAKHNCDSSPGGAGPEIGNWVVYYFEY